MFWVLAVCGVAALLVAPAIAGVEAARLRQRPADVGFWVFARAVAGRCQVRWGRGQSPVVQLPLPEARGRARAVLLPGGHWAVEVRAFLSESAGFAGRVAWPPQPPSRWHAPGLVPVELEQPLRPDASTESNDADRLARWLHRAPVRAALAALVVEVPRIDLRVNGCIVAIRATPESPMSAGAAVEALGGAVVEALRVLVAELADLARAIEASGEAPTDHDCVACGRRLAADPWVCTGCAGALHRGCREMIAGCATAACPHAVDAPPAETVDG